MTDEEIIAAAGEPIAHLRFWAAQCYSGHGDIEFYDGFEVTRTKEKGVDGSDAFPVFDADAILSAVKPLRERIAELEAENEHLKKSRELFAVHAESSLIQLNAALEREKVLRDALAPMTNGFYKINHSHYVAAIAALANDDTK